MDKKPCALILLSLLISCGKQVDISTKKLQYNSSLSDGNDKVVDQTGTLKRGSPDTVLLSGTSYPVSVYSSHLALEFIAGKPMTTEMAVKFRGKVKDSQYVLEYIEAK